MNYKRYHGHNILEAVTLKPSFPSHPTHTFSLGEIFHTNPERENLKRRNISFSIHFHFLACWGVKIAVALLRKFRFNTKQPGLLPLRRYSRKPHPYWEVLSYTNEFLAIFFSFSAKPFQMRARQDYLPKERIENYLNVNPSSSLSSLVPRGMTEDELTMELTDKFANVSGGSNKL